MRKTGEREHELGGSGLPLLLRVRKLGLLLFRVIVIELVFVRLVRDMRWGSRSGRRRDRRRSGRRRQRQVGKRRQEILSQRYALREQVLDLISRDG